MAPPRPVVRAREVTFAEQVLRALPDGLWMFDDHGVTTYANAVMLTMVGRDANQLVGSSVDVLLDEQGREDLARHLAIRDSGAEARRDLECRFHRPDGSAFWALVSHVPLLDDEGERQAWLYRVKDHSEQRALLDELGRREHQLAEAQAVAGVGSWERDVATGVVSWSVQAYRMCRVDPATFEPAEDSFLALLDPRDLDLVLVRYAQMLDGGEPLDVECRLAGGPEKWLRVRGRVVCDDAGEVARISGTLQDVTEAKNNEQGLQFLSTMGRAANEATTLQEVLINSEPLVRPYARWPAVMVAAPRSPDPGADLFYIDLAWAAADEEMLQFARDLVREAVGVRGTVQRLGPGGTVLVVGPVQVGERLACVVVTDTEAGHRAPAGDLVVFEQMLAMLANVAEREWAAEELAAARDAALSASRAKSDFLATMSHEIRTPLNGVIGLSELLRRTELTSHQQRLAAGVDQAGRTLLALVNDILDLSKIEAGRLDLEEVDFDPRAVVEQSAALVADAARGKGLELVVSSAADMPVLVRGDPVRFGQVITNLAANAVKFTATGEVVIRAELDDSRVRVSVRDTGVGIPPDAQEGLFEAFTQADSSTTREYGGTGLGLAISKRIVGAMGGDIGVRSVAGEGSTFWFTAALGAAAEEHSTGRNGVREKVVAGLRVLVVDDNATNRFILTEQLCGWAVDVTAVESAYEALVELDTSVRRGMPYDVVLLDYMMPGTDGEQLARVVRAELRHDVTRLVLLSSATEPAEGWLNKAGIDGFLSKPVLASRLLDTLATVGGHWEPPADQEVGADLMPAADRGRILVVEDNAINQLVAEGVLRRLGFQVQMADDGAAGVAAVADHPDGFVAILMDCQMPVMDGFDATRAVRAIQHGGVRTPIIAMTAAAVSGEREGCLEAGMDDFLAKPVDVRLLGEVLDRWVAPRSAAPASLLSTRLAELLEGGIELSLIAQMAERFEAMAIDLFTALTRAVRESDAAAVGLHAHALSGSAASLGLSLLAQQCTLIERAARVGQLPTGAALEGLRVAIADGTRDLASFVRARAPIA
ncbi:Signal transduction histidine-protein kinase BarA [Nocardioides aquaticus]|uniref:histidine kinase n=1 Tax=Nocardioides aquaticus TaxID=160826 RepID=A0ABX8EKT7_9ACTN|nr:response regulator [Nocardioides aquaticus]QVT80236.1 Signal transduction histidine-protein kinase BarA [Nocardioides aquaticus]